MTIEQSNGIDRKSIPYALRVERFISSDALYQLVHIKQTHVSPTNNSLVRLIDQIEINPVQERILKQLHYLERVRGIAAIYPEGLVRDSVDNVNKALGYARNHLQIMTQQTGIDYLNEFDLNALDRFPAPIPLYGAAAVFSVRSGIPLYACETRKAMDEQISFFEELKRNGKLKSAGRHPVFTKEREDRLLSFIAEDFLEGENRLIVTTYGAKHNFKRAVNDWNNQHPDKKFSLVTITPQMPLKRTDSFFR